MLNRLRNAQERESTVSIGMLAGQKDGRRLIVFTAAGATSYPLPQAGELIVGRSNVAQLHLEDRALSRRHARILIDDLVTIEDLDSANGTYVRGQRLEPGARALVSPGDAIEMGSSLFILQGTHGKRLGYERKSPWSGEPMMEGLRRLIEVVAPSNLSVLLLGETGVGKGIIAEEIHRRSNRASKPFVQLNCAALPDQLLESELFGYEKGAFTGAAQSKPGLLETANGGTVLLDEIGDMPNAVQGKLLRAVEQREVLALGALRPRPIDVRFISATNRDLQLDIRNKTFREDLFFRLNGISLEVPPLRYRVSEIEKLAREFALEATKSKGAVAPPSITEETLSLLKGYRWPGNIRELRNVVERAVLLCSGEPILPSHLPSPVQHGPGPKGAGPKLEVVESLHDETQLGERQRILDALNSCAGNQSRAAAQLGMSRRTLISRIEIYGIPRPRKSSNGAAH
jgi:DNA-binding NtrC family response regulator